MPRSLWCACTVSDESLSAIAKQVEHALAVLRFRAGYKRSNACLPGSHNVVLSRKHTISIAVCCCLAALLGVLGIPVAATGCPISDLPFRGALWQRSVETGETCSHGNPSNNYQRLSEQHSWLGKVLGLSAPPRDETFSLCFAPTCKHVQGMALSKGLVVCLC